MTGLKCCKAVRLEGGMNVERKRFTQNMLAVSENENEKLISITIPIATYDHLIISMSVTPLTLCTWNSRLQACPCLYIGHSRYSAEQPDSRYGRWGCYIMKFQFSTEINRIIFKFWKRSLGLLYYDIPTFNRVQSGLTQ